MAALLLTILQIATLVLIARAVLSWFPIRPGSWAFPIKQTVNRVTDPVLAPVRRVIPPLGGLDLSVLVVLLAINFLLVPVAATL